MVALAMDEANPIERVFPWPATAAGVRRDLPDFDVFPADGSLEYAYLLVVNASAGDAAVRTNYGGAPDKVKATGSVELAQRRGVHYMSITPSVDTAADDLTVKLKLRRRYQEPPFFGRQVA
jgi:hypothetical protein